MNFYSVSKEEFFRFNGADELNNYFQLVHPYCKKPIEHLMDTLEIKGKRLLSIGSGTGFEEFYFSNLNAVTMVDIDEHGLLNPFLQSLQHVPESDFNYCIGDAFSFQSEKIDVMYMSGFAPDELYRRYRSARGLRDPRIRKGICSLLRLSYSYWNSSWEPFIPGFDRLINNADMVIVQSYASVIRGDDPAFLESLFLYFEPRGYSHRVFVNHNNPTWYLIVASRLRKPIPDISWFLGRMNVVRAII